MKALLPIYCRIVGYVVLLLSIFLPFILVIYKVITDENLMFYKESVKLCMIIGLLMILLARTKDENAETDRIRIKSMRYAFFLTILFIFLNMVYHLAKEDMLSADSSAFIVYMAMNVLCLEFNIKKAKVDKMFKK